MKRKVLFLGTMLFIMASCQDNVYLNQPVNEELLEVKELTGIQKDIMVNVLSSKFGGYKKDRPLTRAINSVTMAPYIEDGDTLLYIVQYGEGWEVYSASHAANMVLLSSEKGQFNLDDPAFPSALKSIIMDNVQGIKQLKEMEPREVHLSWGAPSLKTEDFERGKITLNKKGLSRVVKYPEIPSGTWVLLETEELSNDTYVSPKLIQTAWNQNFPWNVYSKSVVTDNGLSKSPAGCAAIAVSQYLYYTHYLNNIPSTTITTATPINNERDYIFSGNSSELWDKMATHYNLSYHGINETAMFIGYIGRSLNAEYKEHGTKVYDNKIVSFLNGIYGNVFSLVSLNYPYIKQSIDKNYPVIGKAGSNKYTSGEVLKKATYHSFLIDGYKETTKTVKYIYGLIRDPWPEGMEDPYASNDIDEKGNIIGWAYTNEVIRSQKEVKITMNWGYADYFDSYYYSPYNDWELNSHVYNLSHSIFKRKDIN